MEDGVVVVAFFHVLLEVGRGFRGLVGEQLQGDDAVVGVQLDHEEIPLNGEGARTSPIGVVAAGSLSGA
ncbi:hypothetical protein D3C72_2407960 [compost metagenome]